MGLIAKRLFAAYVRRPIYVWVGPRYSSAHIGLCRLWARGIFREKARVHRRMTLPWDGQERSNYVRASRNHSLGKQRPGFLEGQILAGARLDVRRWCNRECIDFAVGRAGAVFQPGAGGS